MKNCTKNYIALKICLKHNFEMVKITTYACLGNAGQLGGINCLLPERLW